LERGHRRENQVGLLYLLFGPLKDPDEQSTLALPCPVGCDRILLTERGPRLSDDTVYCDA